MPNISMQNEMIFSKTAMIVEKHAKVINKKNSVPQILPPAIFTNTFGKVMNMSAGPWSGSTPYEKNNKSRHNCHKSIECADFHGLARKSIVL